MTTDNRTNEPTEAQVKAAAKAIYEVSPNGGIEWDSAEFDEWMERGDYLTKARAALVAAQGAAPQLQSDALEFTSEEKELLARYRSKETVESISYKDWKHGNKNYGIHEVLEWAKEARDDVRFGSPWIAYESYRRSVVPANLVPVLEEFLVCTVDEAGLTEVIDKALIRHGEMAGMSNQERWDARDDIARAVAEWLKERVGEIE